VCGAHEISIFQTTSTKSPLSTAAHRLTSVTFNGKELVRYDYDDYGDFTAVYGRDGKKLHGFSYRNHVMVDYRHKRDSVYKIYKKV
jgi:YD repeat-containing protein